MTVGTFIRPRYFEDCIPGAIYEFGSKEVNETEVIDFARRFDPQLFHTDPEWAKQSPFGGIIASGWHTGCMMMRMQTDHFLTKETSLPSPGIEELRWLRPVRPGDRLSVRVTIVDAKRSGSKPDRGAVRLRIEVLNQDREVVMHVKTIYMLLCRELT